MDLVKKLETLSVKLDQLVSAYSELKNENISLQRSLEEKDKELNGIREELEKFKLIKKEGTKIIDNALETLEKIANLDGEKTGESLL